MWKSLAAMVLVSILSGCASYSYLGQKFTSRNEALAFGSKAIAESMASIEPLKQPVGGTARVVFLKREVMMSRYPDNLFDKDYHFELLMKDVNATYDGIRKRNIFNSVTMEYADGGYQTPKKGEAVIYLYSPDRETAAWYFSSETISREPVNFDRGQATLAGKRAYFISTVC